MTRWKREAKHMIYIGTSGYSYDDWIGPFYPPGMAKRQFLSFYAQRFSAVEVNFTFYRVPDQRTLAAMSTKTGPDFQFVIKAHQDMTHQGGENPEVFRQFRDALSPLIEQGKLACVLAQFPNRFKPTRGTVDYLRYLRAQLPDLALVVEFRNRQWITEKAFAFLREQGLGFCCVDQPQYDTLVPPIAQATSELGYIRFHGRNYEKWWQHEEAWERYDYLYSREELTEWVDKTRQLVGQTSDLYVFFNNHYAAQAVQNADLFRDLLTEAGILAADGAKSP